MTEMKVHLTFEEETLGTAPSNPDIFREYIASRDPNGVKEEEIEALPVEDQILRGTTVFPRTPDDKPMFWDYQIKGYFKDACGMLKRIPDIASSKLTAHKKVIDGTIFVFPRRIPLILPEGAVLGFCERPLRAQTAQGERVALARSESAPAGTRMEFTVRMLRDADIKLVEEWLEYGKLRGLSQWCNSGKGRFTYTVSQCLPEMERP